MSSSVLLPPFASPRTSRANGSVVYLAMISAFFAGLGTAEILGPRIFHGIPRAFTIFAVVSFLVGALLFGYAETRAVRKQNNGAGELPANSRGEHQEQR
jgi:hypothetical protein